MLMVDIAHFAGLVAAGIHPSPVPLAEFVTTTTHKTLRGPRGGMILCQEAHAKSLNSSVFPGNQGGPLMHVIAAKAVALQRGGAAGVPCLSAADRRQRAGAGRRADRPRASAWCSGGTDNHLMLIDLRNTELTGKLAQETLEAAHITVNHNTVPFETRSPFVTSGVRIGTPAVTTRGMREAEMAVIADLIARALQRVGDAKALASIADDVIALCRSSRSSRWRHRSPAVQWRRAATSTSMAPNVGRPAASACGGSLAMALRSPLRRWRLLSEARNSASGMKRSPRVIDRVARAVGACRG